MDQPKQPQLMAWCPPGLAPELAAVEVSKTDKLDERLWWAALAERVQEMVDKEPDPEEAAMWAAKTLGRPGLRDAQDAGEVLVRHHLELRTALALDATESFPAKAIVESALVRRALTETDLGMWVDLVADRLSVSSLD
jgi:hypothetical protein